MSILKTSKQLSLVVRRNIATVSSLKKKLYNKTFF